MKIIILDRDGVINQDSDNYIKSLEEWKPIPGSIEAISRLYHADYRIVVITNQSGISRGYFNLETLNKMHNKLINLVRQNGAEIEAIFFCPHAPDQNCICRKPKPGLFLELSKRMSVDLTNIPAIGDSLRDLQAAKAVGAKPILVKTGKGKRTIKKSEEFLNHENIEIYEDLAEFVDKFLMKK